MLSCVCPRKTDLDVEISLQEIKAKPRLHRPCCSTPIAGVGFHHSEANTQINKLNVLLEWLIDGTKVQHCSYLACVLSVSRGNARRWFQKGHKLHLATFASKTVPVENGLHGHFLLNEWLTLWNKQAKVPPNNTKESCCCIFMISIMEWKWVLNNEQHLKQSKCRTKILRFNVCYFRGCEPFSTVVSHDLQQAYIPFGHWVFEFERRPTL